MKIIGVEFRVEIHNHVMGPRRYEIFLHPTDLEMPDDLGQILANVTVHTSQGDRGGQNFEIRQPSFMHHNNEEIKRAVERFEEKYFSESPKTW